MCSGSAGRVIAMAMAEAEAEAEAQAAEQAADRATSEHDAEGAADDRDAPHHARHDDLAATALAPAPRRRP